MRRAAQHNAAMLTSARATAAANRVGGSHGGRAYRRGLRRAPRGAALALALALGGEAGEDEEEEEEEGGEEGGCGAYAAGAYPLRATLDVWRRKKQLNALDAVGRAFLEVMAEAEAAGERVGGEEVIERVGARSNLGRGRALLAPLRLCVTGQMAGPALPGAIDALLRSTPAPAALPWDGEGEGVGVSLGMRRAELAEVLAEERADAAMPRVRVLRRAEEAGMLVVSKPGALLSHRRSDATPREKEEGRFLNTLVERQHRVGKAHLVNRLDRGTSGAVVVGVDAGAAKRLQRALARPGTEKQYLVLARGQTPAGHFASDAPLSVAAEDGGGGGGVEPKACRTEFETLMHFPEGRVSLLRATLRTGRRHQIRRHLDHMAHHVVGDSVYGKGRDNRHARVRFALRPSRMFLHAYRLRLTVPRGERVGDGDSDGDGEGGGGGHRGGMEDGEDVVVVDPLPRDLVKVLMRLPGAPSRSTRLALLANLYREGAEEDERAGQQHMQQQQGEQQQQQQQQGYG